jgi:small subunit ribosomal protein S6
MNIYENIVIFNVALSDEEVEAAIGKIKALITGSGGEVITLQIWGRRKLAYEINKHKRGLYVFLVFKTPSATIKKLEEFYRVFDAVIKQMIIKRSAKQVEYLEKIETLPETLEQKGEAKNV